MIAEVNIMKIYKKDFFKIVASHPVRYFGPVGTVMGPMVMFEDFIDARIIGFWNQRKKSGTLQEMPEIFATEVTNDRIKFSDGCAFIHKPYTNYRRVILPNNEGSILIAKTNYGDQCWYYVNVI